MTKILLVEDNEMNRDMLSRRLMRKGYEVVMAVDGQQGGRDGGVGAARPDPDGYEPAGDRRLGGDAAVKAAPDDPRDSGHRADRARHGGRSREGDGGRLRRLRHQADRSPAAARKDRGAARSRERLEASTGSSPAMTDRYSSPGSAPAARGGCRTGRRRRPARSRGAARRSGSGGRPPSRAAARAARSLTRKAGCGLPRRAEAGLDAEMDLERAALEPAAAAGGERQAASAARECRAGRHRRRGPRPPRPPASRAAHGRGLRSSSAARQLVFWRLSHGATAADKGGRKNNQGWPGDGDAASEDDVLGAIAVAVAAVAPARADAPSPVGHWLVQDRRAVIEVYACGAQFCGKIVWQEQPIDPPTVPSRSTATTPIRRCAATRSAICR